ncbi:hypothetical protein B0H21DRAFT_863300 [Amylocystis lapponica]|nr:hypothetical protein B0H21DRAFT_863300 [Amylocystis lapponica]
MSTFDHGQRKGYLETDPTAPEEYSQRAARGYRTHGERECGTGRDKYIWRPSYGTLTRAPYLPSGISIQCLSSDGPAASSFSRALLLGTNEWTLTALRYPIFVGKLPGHTESSRLIGGDAGIAFPEYSKLEFRNVTQTSMILEQPPLKLASAKLRSLDIYRNHRRLAAILSPSIFFSILLRCFRNVQDCVLLENTRLALLEMSARKNQSNTTHSVYTTPAMMPNGAQARQLPGYRVSEGAAAPHYHCVVALDPGPAVPSKSASLSLHSRTPLTDVQGLAYPPMLPRYEPCPFALRLHARSMFQANLVDAAALACLLRPAARIDQPASGAAQMSCLEAPEEREPSSSLSDEENSDIGRRRKVPPLLPKDAPKSPLESVRTDAAKEVGRTAVGVIAPSSVKVPPSPPVNKGPSQSVLESAEELG